MRVDVNMSLNMCTGIVIMESSDTDILWLVFSSIQPIKLVFIFHIVIDIAHIQMHNCFIYIYHGYAYCTS